MGSQDGSSVAVLGAWWHASEHTHVGTTSPAAWTVGPDPSGTDETELHAENYRQYLPVTRRVRRWKTDRFVTCELVTCEHFPECVQFGAKSLTSEAGHWFVT